MKLRISLVGSLLFTVVAAGRAAAVAGEAGVAGGAGAAEGTQAAEEMLLSPRDVIEQLIFQSIINETIPTALRRGAQQEPTALPSTQ